MRSEQQPSGTHVSDQPPLSGRAKGLLNRAQDTAGRRGRTMPLTAQLLLLLYREGGPEAHLLREAGLDETRLLETVRRAREESSGVQLRLLRRARQLARQAGERLVEPSHLFWAITSDPGTAAARALRESGALERLRPATSGRPTTTVALRPMCPGTAPPSSSPTPAAAPALPPPSPLRRNRVRPEPPRARRPAGTASKAAPRSKPKRETARWTAKESSAPPRTAQQPAARPATARARALPPRETPQESLDARRFPMLSACCLDLVAEARLRPPEPLVDADGPLQRVLDVLGRRRAPHALLLGPSGVGKSALGTELARRIAERDASLGPFAEARLIALSTSALLAGTAVRGALAERLEVLFREAESLGPRSVLFVDDLHDALGEGGPEDLGTLLRPWLTRSTVRLLATMPEAAHEKLGARHGALLRHFTPVHLEPPDEEGTERILRAQAPGYAAHHGVRFEEEALRAAVRLSQRYLSSPAQPDRALSVLDQAAARTARLGHGRVDRETVARVVAERCHVPVERLLRSDAERLLSLRERLAERIVGHEEALDHVAAALRRAAAGFRGARPMGSFLLLGPTGVGKTETARAIAEELFGGAMLRLDMAEFAEAHAVARLLGAPPGYVGHEAGGQLTEPVRRRPYQLVLLDEIEKAHPQVWLALLSLLDEGHLTDGRGRRVDFRHTVVVLTSNLGAETATGPSRRSVGFASAGDTAAQREADAQAARALQAARAALPPELWNRIDAPLWFGPLSREQVRRIASLRLEALARRLREEHDTTLRWEAPVLDLLLERGGWDPQLGARPMRRTVEKLVEQPLADALLAGRLPRGGTLQLRVEDGSLALDVPSAEQETPCATPAPAPLRTSA